MPELAHPVEILNSVMEGQFEMDRVQAARIHASPESRLVAFSAPTSIGAEKFRALVLRLENLRVQQELKSLQVTSSVVSEGKSLITANLAVTLATHKQAKVLLLEGDLHRPSLAPLLGLEASHGLSQWWSETGTDLTPFLYRLNDLPLCFLCAGRPQEKPSDILQSARFGEAFASIASRFDWVVVDSTPMLPIVDVNLWSRLVDGTLLVVREGITPVSVLKTGLENLDNANLIGVVLNEACASDQANYKYSYYSPEKKKRFWQK
ncbi:MAG: CpsD/CapB family tyrosine-protein kinase [Candidatus Acidiferrales bacterium]